MADTVANAYVQIIPSAKGIKEGITDALAPAAEDAGTSAGESINSGILGKLEQLKGPLMALGGTLLAAVGIKKIATALLDVGAEFDEMRDTIIIGTGASGEALEGLVDVAEAIATTVPVSFADAGDFVQNLNTRMGLVGDELEAVGTRVAALGELTGSAIDLDSLTGALNQFGISGEDAAEVMDYLWGVSQSTGIGFDDLTKIIEANAPALQALGFSFEEAANMAGLLDRAGLDANGTMGKLSKALVELAQPGESAEDAFHRVVGQIGEYIEAGDEAAALDLATQIFGTRGATQFVAAVESGALSLEELEDAALGAGDGILGTYEATMDWPEQWELLKNKAKEALEPLGGALMEGATKAMEALSEAFDEIDPAVFEELGTALGDVLAGAVDILSGAIQFLVENKEPLGEFFAFWIDGITGVIEWIANIIVAVTDFCEAVPVKFEELKAKVSEIWENIKSKVSETVESIKTNVTTAWENIKAKVSEVVESVKTKVSTTFDTLKSKVSTTWESIKTAITDPINKAKEAVKNAIDKIKGFFNFSVSWPHIPVPKFGISPSGWSVGDLLKGVIPHLSVTWAATGGIIQGPTLYGVGVGERGPELVWPSYSPYLERYADALAGAMGGGGNTYIIDGSAVAADAQLAAALEVVAQRVTARNRMGSVRA